LTSEPFDQDAGSAATHALPSPLVDTAWLEAHLTDPDLRVFDCTTSLTPDPATIFRVASGRTDWARAHVPGAGFLDVDGELSDRTSGLLFTLPTPERFAAVMSEHGVGDGIRVVLYSAKSHIWATRVWWMLRVFGFDGAAVLDGGWEKWTREGRPVGAGACAYPPARFEARLRPGLVAGTTEVAASAGRGGACLINALAARVHTGESELHHGRPGHIPGSVNVPYLDLVDPATGAFRPAAELRARLEAAGALAAPRVISYCGGGIAATAVALALALLGRDDVAVYDGSMQEWCADPARPVERGVGGPA
jgi:thiosulfate/3-mercaptopyruvate sulfurtransferase